MANTAAEHEADLPDLAQTPDVETKQNILAEEGDLIEKAVEALHPGGEIDFVELAERAKVYEEKLDREHKDKEAGKDAKDNKPVSPPVVSPAPQEASETVNLQKGKKPKGKGSKAAKLALVGATALPDVKPAPPSEAPVVKLPPVSVETPDKTPEPIGATWDDAETKTPKLGDEEFPAVPVPDHSREYTELSAISSQYEEVSGDLSSLFSKVERLTSVVGELNVRMAHYEKEVKKVQEDKSAFHSQILDRLRVIERDIGNRPSLGTKANEAVVAGPSKGKEPAKPVAEESLDDVDVGALLAKLGM